MHLSQKTADVHFRLFCLSSKDSSEVWSLVRWPFVDRTALVNPAGSHGGVLFYHLQIYCQGPKNFSLLASTSHFLKHSFFFRSHETFALFIQVHFFLSGGRVLISYWWMHGCRIMLSPPRIMTVTISWVCPRRVHIQKVEHKMMAYFWKFQWLRWQSLVTHDWCM